MINKITASLWSCMLFLLFAHTVSAQEINPINGVLFVKEMAPGIGCGSGDGSSWSNGASLGEALEAARVKEIGINEIRVAGGEYFKDKYYDPDSPFFLPESINLYGGYTAGEDGDETRIPGTSILNGSRKVGHLLVILGYTPGAETRIDGFTITQGGKTDDRVNKVYNPNWENPDDSFIVIHGYGAGIYIETRNGSRVIVSNNVIVDNEIVHTSNNELIRNYGGAAIYAQGKVSITGNTITNNRVTVGITSTYHTPDACGAGLFLIGDGEGIEVVKNNIYSNTATGNIQRARSKGAGLYLSGKVSVSQNLIYENSALSVVANDGRMGGAYGGGIYVDDTDQTDVTLLNNTITGNEVVSSNSQGGMLEGGGIYSRSAKLKLYNTIVWNNTRNSLANNLYLFGEAIIRNSLEADPLFVDAANGDYRLGHWSPAVNTGENTLFPGLDSAGDLDGKPRLVDFGIDIGAYEYQEIQVLPDENGILYVNPNSTGAVLNGSTWSKAIPDINQGLTAAARRQDINEIWVTEGTYYPTELIAELDDLGDATTDKDKAFLIPEGLIVRGGFSQNAMDGDGIEAQNTELYKSILSGNNNSYHVVVAISNEKDIIIDGFTITEGLASGRGFTQIADHKIHRNYGAGVYALSSEEALVILQNNTIELNTVEAEAEGNVMEMKPEGDWTGEGADVIIQKLSEQLTALIGQKTEDVLRVLSECPPLGNQVDAITEKMLTPLIERFINEATGNKPEEFLANDMAVYYGTTASDGRGAGVYAEGQLMMENNLIWENTILSSALINSANEQWTGEGFLAIPIANAQGAGVYVLGDLLMGNNEVETNTIQAEAKTYTDETEENKNISYFNIPLTMAMGAGVYVSGSIYSQKDIIERNLINSNSEHEVSNTTFQTLLENDKSNYCNNSGFALSYGGGACLNGDIIIEEGSLSGNWIEVKAVADLSGMSLSYGGGLLASGIKEADAVVIYNTSINDNNISSVKTASSDDEDPLIYLNNLAWGGGAHIVVNGESNIGVIEGASFDNNTVDVTSGAYGGGLSMNGRGSSLSSTFNNNFLNVSDKVDFRFQHIFTKNLDEINSFFDTLNITENIWSYFKETESSKEGYTISPTAVGAGLYAVGNLDLEDNEINANEAASNTELVNQHQGNNYIIKANSSAFGGGAALFGKMAVGNTKMLSNKIYADFSSKNKNPDTVISMNMAGGGLYWDARILESDKYNPASSLMLEGNTINSNRLDNKLKSNGKYYADIQAMILGGGVYAKGEVIARKNTLELNTIYPYIEISETKDNMATLYSKGGGLHVQAEAELSLLLEENNINDNLIDAAVRGDDSRRNKSNLDAFSFGGGISIEALENTKLTIYGNSITGNKSGTDMRSENTEESDEDANSSGGGIYLKLIGKEGYRTTSSLQQNLISGNEAYTYSNDDNGEAILKSFGGGMYVEASYATLALNRESILSNIAKAKAEDGEGDNEVLAHAFGGGLYMDNDENTELKIVNTLIAANKVDAWVNPQVGNEVTGGGKHKLLAHGGGWFNKNKGTSLLLNSTIADNLVTSYPNVSDTEEYYDIIVEKEGAGLNNNPDAGQLTVSNSIFWDNLTKNNNGDGFNGRDIRNQSNRAIGLQYTFARNVQGDVTRTNDWPENFSPTNPKFVDNNYSLQEDSPLIGRGNNSYYERDSWDKYDLAAKPRLVARIDLGAYEYETQNLYVWTGDVSKSWNEGANWEPSYVPNELDIVYIPAGRTYYPQAQTGDECKNIYFMQGGSLGNQHKLTYEQAFVQLNLGLQGPEEQVKDDSDVYDRLAFSAKHSSPLDRDRWYMLSSPLQEIVSGDLGFGGYPNTFLRKFSINENEDKPFAVGNWSNYFRTNAEPIAAGEGFVYHVRGYKDAPYYREGGNEGSMMYPDGGTAFGLAEVNGILELPFFEDESTSQAHRLHQYDQQTGVSTFGRITSSGDELPLTENTDSFTRDVDKAYKLAPEKISSTMNFSDDFVLLGNPFMTGLSFNSFWDTNASALKNYYLVWAGSGFAAYSLAGDYSGPVDAENNAGEAIAPMQSFLVERNSSLTDESATIDFDLTSMAANSSGQLKSPQNTTDNKIRLTATNKAGSILTFIAYHEEGTPDYGKMDTRKILMGMSDIPEVYSLKNSDKGTVAVGGNYLNTNEALVPLGLATSLAGSMSFALEGMDRYEAVITFIDTETQTEVDITGKPYYEYTFNYTPQRKDDNTLSNNSRFFLRFAQPVGINKINNTDDRVYLGQSQGQILAVASDDNLIRECYVYNTQGNLLYSDSKIDSTTYRVDLSQNKAEVLIVRLVTKKGVEIRKFLIK